jgi:hypothetical protein
MTSGHRPQAFPARRRNNPGTAETKFAAERTSKMKTQFDHILIRGTEIAERRIRTARRLQAEEVKRRVGSLTRTIRRIGERLRNSLLAAPFLGEHRRT